MNKVLLTFLGIGVFISFSGCSTAKKTAYESLQSIDRQQCLKEGRTDCDQQPHYEQYKKELESRP